MAPTNPGAGTSSREHRTVNPSARQRKANENKADEAAKTAAKKKKAQEATARKQKRSSNTAQAAALREATNTVATGETLSAEAQIAALTARLKTAEAKAEVLGRKNKKLTKSIQRTQARTDTDITPIPKPKGKFNIQSSMGLEDNRALFTDLQAGVHGLAHEAKIDFESTWTQQDPATVAKILRVHDYLTSKRFPRGWATSSILQRYINSVRAYKSGKANPTSGVNRRRERLTNVGRSEVEASRRTRRNTRVVMSPPAEDEDLSENQMDVDADGGGSQAVSVTRDSSPSSNESDSREQEDILGSDGSGSDEPSDEGDDGDDPLGVAPD